MCENPRNLKAPFSVFNFALLVGASVKIWDEDEVRTMDRFGCDWMQGSRYPYHYDVGRPDRYTSTHLVHM